MGETKTAHKMLFDVPQRKRDHLAERGVHDNIKTDLAETRCGFGTGTGGGLL
jgi:hypothetical protein